MKLNDREKEISEQAKDWIKNHEELLINKFADDENHPPQEDPMSIFTAGSFGAGKTEFSKRLAEESPGIVLIDADEIRKLCPNYDGQKAYIFNYAAFVGQDMLHDYVLENSKHFVFDSTFSNYQRGKENIERSLSRGRSVEIYYVFQYPKIAWLFTQVRAQLYGRHISKEAFIKSFLRPKDVVNRVKEDFGDKITLYAVQKSTSSEVSHVEPENLSDSELKELKRDIVRKDFYADIDKIDNHIPFDYSEDTFKSLL